MTASEYFYLFIYLDSSSSQYLFKCRNSGEEKIKEGRNTIWWWWVRVLSWDRGSGQSWGWGVSFHTALFYRNHYHYCCVPWPYINRKKLCMYSCNLLTNAENEHELHDKAKCRDHNSVLRIFCSTQTVTYYYKQWLL